VTLLTRGFLNRGHDVSIITFFPATADFYEVPQGADRIALGINQNSPTAFHGVYNNVKRLRILRRTIESTAPDVVISHIHRTNVITLLALRRLSVPIIVVEHNEPGMSTVRRGWDRLRRVTYPGAQKLVSVSHGVDNHFTWLPASKRAVIHNPITMDGCYRAEKGLSNDLSYGARLITAMGRLTAQKGFDLLLSAFSLIAHKYPDWKLIVIGDGELRLGLETLRDDLSLAGRVDFVGLLSEPMRLLKSSQLFVMASRFEGFPYAALEAMACGLPVIYTDCPSGPREIISHGVDGVLVPNGDVNALATAMDRLLSDKNERRRLGERATEVVDRFGLERIIDQWEDLLTNGASKTRDEQ
jgi:GalNAc-alpha-(1->4)-GalNAc-alpha-(1->3)-diNAcBac-PP-undecaprenol alpha-1,4-N-acetyl-D-galactosaminyltransferase